MCARSGRKDILYTVYTSLQNNAGRFNSCAHLVQQDCVLALELSVEGPEHPIALLFVWFILLSGQSGPHGPTQTFIQMDTEAELSTPMVWHGFELRLLRAPFVAAKKRFRPPLHRSRSGEFRTMTEQLLAKKVIFCLEDKVVSKVRISRVSFTDVSLDTIAVTGLSEDFDPIIVTPIVPDAGSAGGGRGKGKAGVGGRGKGRGRGPHGQGRGGGGQVDLMDVLERVQALTVPHMDGEAPQAGHVYAGDQAQPKEDDAMKTVAAALGLPLEAIAEVPEVKEAVAGLAALQAELLVPEGFAEEVDEVLDAIEEHKAEEELHADGDGDVEEEEEEEEEVVEEPQPQDLLEERHPNVFHAPSGRLVGQFTRAPVGRKATCKVQQGCECWVSRAVDLAELDRSLKIWLAEVATPEPRCKQDHQISAYRLKVSFGMKPRKPPGL